MRKYKYGRPIREIPEYLTWQEMKQRCFNPKHKGFAYWGGRGITICDRWRESFQAFYEDMGPRPEWAYCIDRIDNDGNYEPGNCRWTDLATSNRNKRAPTREGGFSKKYLETALKNLPRYERFWIIDGRLYLKAAEAANELGLTESTIARWCNGRPGNKQPPKPGCFWVDCKSLDISDLHVLRDTSKQLFPVAA